MSDEDRPQLVVISGPNGAGKTTLASRLLQKTFRVQEFVNADYIAAGLSVFNPESVAMHAGQIMLSRIRELASQRASFGFETTLASKTFAPLIRHLITIGYEFHLLFLYLPTANLAVARVGARVKAGGHSVPEEIIRRRYARGLQNFFKLYQPLARTWQMMLNAGDEQTTIIARGRFADVLEIHRNDLWDAILRSNTK